MNLLDYEKDELELFGHALEPIIYVKEQIIGTKTQILMHELLTVLKEMSLLDNKVEKVLDPDSRPSLWLLKDLDTKVDYIPWDYPCFEQVMIDLELTMIELGFIIEKLESTWLINEIGAIIQLIHQLYDDFEEAERLISYLDKFEDSDRKKEFLLAYNSVGNQKFKSAISYEIERLQLTIKFKSPVLTVKNLPPVRPEPSNRVPFHPRHDNFLRGVTGSENVPLIYQGTGLRASLSVRPNVSSKR